MLVRGPCTFRMQTLTGDESAMTKARNGNAHPYFDKSKKRFYVEVWHQGSMVKKVSGRTAAECQDMANRLRIQLADGERVALDSHRTVQQFLAQWEAEVLPGASQSARTTEIYKGWLRLYVIPAIGHIKLSALDFDDVERMQKQMAARGLSKSTINGARKVLGKALNWALRKRWVRFNAVQLADPAGGREARKTPHLEGEEIRRFAEHIEGDRLEALFLCYLYLALRRGEALGLRWGDIDFQSRTVHVQRQICRRASSAVAPGHPKTELVVSPLKTAKSDRLLPLPPVVYEALRTRRTDQRRERMAMKAWPETDLVFTTTEGTPLDPDNVKNLVVRASIEAGVRRISTHGLRHTAASALFAAGVDIKVISEILGHSTTRLTSDLYVHVQQPGFVDAMDRLSAALGAKPTTSPDVAIVTT